MRLRRHGSGEPVKKQEKDIVSVDRAWFWSISVTTLEGLDN